MSASARKKNQFWLLLRPQIKEKLLKTTYRETEIPHIKRLGKRCYIALLQFLSRLCCLIAFIIYFLQDYVYTQNIIKSLSFFRVISVTFLLLIRFDQSRCCIKENVQYLLLDIFYLTVYRGDSIIVQLYRIFFSVNHCVLWGGGKCSEWPFIWFQSGAIPVSPVQSGGLHRFNILSLPLGGGIWNMVLKTGFKRGKKDDFSKVNEGKYTVDP